MTVVSDAEVVWQKSSVILSEQVSEAVFNATFKDIRGLYLDENCLTIQVPTKFIRERIDQRYRELILAALSDVHSHSLGLEIRIDDDVEVLEDLDDLLADLTRENLGVGGDVVDVTTPPSMRERPSNINPKYSFDSFVTGPSNRFAQAAALSVAETPARAYNPLFVYGAAGLGKTHLLQAIAQYVGENYPTYQVRYISTETLLNEFIDAIRNNSQSEFKRRYREIDVLLVDDVQFMEGKEQLQEEFFHTFNTLHEANRQIVLSSDRPPDAVATLEDRLRSRFKMGLVTDIQPPDFETRLAILRKKAAQSNTPISHAVLEFIVTHITNNIRELEGALNRVTAYASLNRTQVSVEDAERILHDIIAERGPRQITPQLILEATAEKYNFTVDDLKAKDRRRPLVTARQVGMYLFRELTDLSYPNIAKEFGGRDHTTVIHAYDKISALMKERQAIYDDVQSLIQTLKSV
ncbi:MAG TPA: chromosomal replication initiator protein DnaA [Microthrixaceae bacterium]|nr:chromosomal replication initiator protein DnaA [Microthrixaceae bacterium]